MAAEFNQTEQPDDVESRIAEIERELERLRLQEEEQSASEQSFYGQQLILE